MTENKENLNTDVFERNRPLGVIVLVAMLFMWAQWFMPKPVPQNENDVPQQESDTTYTEQVFSDTTFTATTSVEITAVDVDGATETLSVEVKVVPEVKVAPKVKEKVFTISNDALDVVVSNIGGAVNDIVFRKFFLTVDEEIQLPFMEKKYSGRAAMSGLKVFVDDVEFNFDTVAFSVVEKTDSSIRLRAKKGNVVVDRVFHLDTGVGTPEGLSCRPASHVLGIDVIVRVEDNEEHMINVDMIGAVGAYPDDKKGGRFAVITSELFAAPAGMSEGAVEHLASSDVEEEAFVWSTEGIRYIGLKNRYFSSLLAPRDFGGIIKIGVLRFTPETIIPDSAANENLLTWVKTRTETVAANESVSFELTLYTGPTDADVFAYASEEGQRVVGIEPSFSNTVVYGWNWSVVQFFASMMNSVLGVIHSIIGNWGFSIILLTCIVKTLLHPLQRKQMVSMHRMQQIQPMVKKIQQKYKNDTSQEGKQKMSMETMGLYRDYGVNPLAGCLPLFVQLPMFIALYGVLSAAFAIRQAPFFLWINDLSGPDTLIENIGFAIPFIGSSLNILPLLYMLLSILHMRLSPKPVDEQQQQQQKMMMFMMPIMFFFLFYNMPSGLVLYFVTSTLYMAVETWIIRRKLDSLPLPTKKAKKLNADGSKPQSKLEAWTKMAQQAADDKKKNKKNKRKGK